MCIRNQSLKTSVAQFLKIIFAMKKSNAVLKLKVKEDGWLSTENHWCPLLDLSYHYFNWSITAGIYGRNGLGKENQQLVNFAVFVCPRGAWDRDETCVRRWSFFDLGWMNGVTCHHFQHHKDSEGMLY